VTVHLEDECAKVEQHRFAAAAQDPQPAAHRPAFDEVGSHQAGRLEEALDRKRAGIIARVRRLVAITCLAVAVTQAAGCGSDRASRGEGTVRVVATVAPLADIVHNAGGRRVLVTTLVPRAADPHRWRPGAAEREQLRQADLVVWTGGALDRWAAASGNERVLGVLPEIDPLGDDPHWWQDPVRVERAAKEIRNELARADVDGAGYYEAATADFLERLRKLHRDIRTCMSLLSRPRVRLVAQHDAFAYFNDRYETRIVGPRDRGASVGRRLWADSLGSPGSSAGSYFGAMAANTAIIVDALSRGEHTCRPEP
jgi:ABC-type Zn uptake system ZnuABC Zn-binding protein ZnuA